MNKDIHSVRKKNTFFLLLPAFAYKARHTIKYRFLISIILIILIPLAMIGIFFYTSISSNLKTEANKNLNYYIRSVNNELQDKFKIIDSTSMLFLADKSIGQILDNEEAGDIYSKSRNITIADEHMNSMVLFSYAWDSKLIRSIFVFKNDTTYYSVLRESYYQKSIQDNLRVFQSSEKSTMNKLLVPPSAADPTIYLVRNYNDLDTMKYKGKLVVAVNLAALSNLEQSNFQYTDSQIFTFDNSGIVFSSGNKASLGHKVAEQIYNVRNSSGISELTFEGRKYFAASKSINEYGLYNVIIVPENSVFKNLNSSILQYLAIILLIGFISLFIGLFIYSRVTKPMGRLLDNINQVKNGNFNIKMPIYNLEELDELSNVFNTMTDEIHNLINQVYEKQLLLKESELELLQSQVNPHFLFNVLETISWHARMSENETIYKMVTSLGQLLRANIRISGNEKITIREELKYIKFYLDLQKARYEDRLNIEISVSDDEILSYYLPKLCIQPIVENAIIHGLEGKRGKGKLSLQIWEEQQEVYISVTDNGIGFNSESMDLELSNHILMRKQGHTSIGLFNANKRIKLLYGARYGISIESKPEKGTKVIVNIPIDKEGMQSV